MPPVQSTKQTSDAWEDEANEPEFKPLTPEEALQWRARQPVLSVWRLVGIQCMVGLVAAAIAWWWSGSDSLAASVLYGAASVVIPTALMAWGMTSSNLARRSAGHVISMFMSFVWWEGVKILLSVAMLWLAPRIVPDLNWLALVAGLVVVLKVYWFGFWIQTRRSS